jgi:hypothetical protein
MLLSTDVKVNLLSGMLVFYDPPGEAKRRGSSSARKAAVVCPDAWPNL